MLRIVSDMGVPLTKLFVHSRCFAAKFCSTVEKDRRVLRLAPGCDNLRHSMCAARDFEITELYRCWNLAQGNSDNQKVIAAFPSRYREQKKVGEVGSTIFQSPDSLLRFAIAGS